MFINVSLRFYLIDGLLGAAFELDDFLFGLTPDFDELRWCDFTVVGLLGL